MLTVDRLMGLACAFLVLAACSNSEDETPRAPEPQTVIVDEARPVATGNGAVGPRRFTGRIAAVSTVDVSFQVSGKITALPIDEGDIVPAGTVLAKLDKADYELAVREAQAAFDLAQSDLKRKRELVRTNVVSEATLDKSETEFRVKEVELDTARLNLSYTTIKAPFDALISSRLVEAQTNVDAGTPVLRIQDVSELRVDISVPEDLMRSSQNPEDNPEAFEIVAIATGIDGTEYRFPLEFRENQTEPDDVTQTFTVTFGMPRPTEPNLLPGMTVTVMVALLGEGDGVSVSVPLTAIVDEADGGHSVFVYDPETQTVSKRRVEIGPVMNERIVVHSGLSRGDTVIAAGARRLQDGAAVRLMSDQKG